MAGPTLHHEVDFIREVGSGADKCLLAKVDFRVMRDELDPHGDNLSIHVRLPPDAENMNFESLQALAAKTALRLLSAVGRTLPEQD